MNIQAQLAKGVYQKDIAHQMGVHPKTISRAIKWGGPPSGKRPGARRSKLDPFKPFINTMFVDGIWNAMVILREIQARGYTGKSTICIIIFNPNGL